MSDDDSGRLADAARSLATGVRSGGRGALRTAGRGVLGIAVAAHALAGRRRGAARLFAVALARLSLQVPADAALLLLTRVVSALQTLLGVERPGRRLDADERALARRVFGASLDPRPVRLKVGPLGLLGLVGRPFVVGDTLFVPQARHARPAGSLAKQAPALLVHELTHVWQHQRHGTRYLSECLLAQWLGDGYNVAVALATGRGFGELNFEQQAELVERAFAAGWFDDGDERAAARLLLRLTDRQRDDGFAVALASCYGAAELVAAGWMDATPLLDEARAAMAG